MGRKRQEPITDAELAVVEVMWARGPSTIRQIMADLYPGETVSDYATVQKLLERLEGKLYVHRDRTGLAHIFSPAIERSDLIDQRLQAVAEKLCDGSLTPLLMHLVRSAPLSANDREALRRLIDQPKPNTSG